ncbi:helix-turn-helix domain-containing protein [Caballeronia sp. LjRoot34]|uniref:helix-turn-helix domain-containing protein n=1 Tax=Caballeronia sp. LjRoot34 TaxID=3342325 RepID=UPI003ECC6EF2
MPSSQVIENPELAAWESATSHGLLPMSLALPDGDQHGTPRYAGRFRQLSAFRIARLSVDGIIALPRVGSSGGGRHVKVLLVTSGQTRIWQDERSTTLRAGTWAMYDPSCPYRIDSTGPYECVAAAIPTGLLGASKSFSVAALTRASPIRGNMRLALDAMTFCLNGDLNEDQDDLDATGEAILTLIEAGVRRHVGVTGATGPQERAAALLSRSEHYIRAHYADPEFTTERLAETLQVSRRTLYNALQSQSQTPYKIIQQYRLEASCRALKDAAQRHKNVTDIALESGFADSTHFSRLFRRTFGTTPTEYRKQFSTALID